MTFQFYDFARKTGVILEGDRKTGAVQFYESVLRSRTDVQRSFTVFYGVFYGVRVILRQLVLQYYPPL